MSSLSEAKNVIKWLANLLPSLYVMITLLVIASLLLAKFVPFVVSVWSNRKTMSDAKRNHLKKAGIISCLLFCWGIVFVTLFLILQLSVWDFIKFVSFLLFYIIIPGYLFARKIRKIQNYSVLFALCSISGMSILAGVFIVASFFDILFLIYWIGPICSVLSGILFFKDLKNHCFEKTAMTVDINFLCVISFFLMYSVTPRALGAFPNLSGDTSIFMDSLYIITNSSAMTGGLFADSLNFPGFLLRYHAVTNLLQACAIRITGISAVQIFLVYWPFFYLPTGLTAIYALITTFRENNRFASLSVFFMFFSEYLTVAIFHLFDLETLNEKLYMAMGNLEAYYLMLPNGIDIAIPAILGAAIVMIKYYREECSTPFALLLSFLFTGLATGAKAPFGVCICGALTGTILFTILQRKEKQNLLKPVLLLAASVSGFFIIYFVMIYNPSPMNKSTISLFDLSDARSSLHFEYTYQRLLEYLPAEMASFFYRHEYISLLLMLPVSMFFILPFFMPMFFAWVANRLLDFKNITQSHMLMCGIAICGLCGHYFIAIDGYSQVYFFFSAIIFIEILGFYWAVDHYKSFHYMTKYVFVILLVFSSFFFLHSAAERIHSSISRTIQIVKYQASGKETTPLPDWDRITAYEYEGMEWLRENTPSDALIAVDRYFISYTNPEDKLASIDQALYFYYPAYSERHMFLTGFSYSPRTDEMTEWLENQISVLDRLYAPNYRKKSELMEKYHIDYLVVSKFISGDLEIRDKKLKRVFENRDIAIYQLLID